MTCFSEGDASAHTSSQWGINPVSDEEGLSMDRGAFTRRVSSTTLAQVAPAFKKKEPHFLLSWWVQTDLERDTLNYPIPSVPEPHET